ncbi:MAG: GNAT family N-acetyltransferase [Candidatus Competibacteraceae bacterium]
MNVIIMNPTDDINILRPLAEEWAKEVRAAEYDFPTDVGIGLDFMRGLMTRSDGDVLVLMDGEKVCGCMGLMYRPNHVGPGMIANESLFYLTQSARSGGGAVELIQAARKVALSKGCNFFFLNASRMAGDADRSRKLYERMGFKHIESSYMAVLCPVV